MLGVLRANDKSLEELKLQGSFSRDGLESEILRYTRKISKRVGSVMAERLRECQGRIQDFRKGGGGVWVTVKY